MSSQRTVMIPAARIERRILLLGGEKVMLDSDLAELYGVGARALNQAVKRNPGRFPADFMFRLSAPGTRLVREFQMPDSLQFVPSSGTSPKTKDGSGANSSQPVMRSSGLRGDRPVQVNIAIMQTFVQLRQMLASRADLASKLRALERKYDKQFRSVFDAIRALMTEKERPRREMGFHTLMPKPAKVAGAKTKRF